MLQTKQNVESQDINLKQLKQAYSRIKRRCLFQKFFSAYLVCVFFLLQYSVPIFLVVLGSVATSEEQLTLFFQKSEAERQTPAQAERQTPAQAERQIPPEAEIIASRIIFLLGLITVLLGVINNIIQPAKSYDKSAKFNNKFFKFDLDLDLEIIKSGGIPESSGAKNFNCLVNLLCNKTQELSKLIDEYNQARSLSSQTPDIEEIIQQINEHNKVRQLQNNTNESNQASLNGASSSP